MSNKNFTKSVAIIVAAGRGVRASSEKVDLPKQYQRIGQDIILTKTLEVFANNPNVDEIVVVINNNDLDHWQVVKREFSNCHCGEVVKKLTKPVIGGSTRQLSVFAGLKSLSNDPPRVVVVHDAVRPFVSSEVITKIIQAVSEDNPAILAATPAVDTLKRVDETMTITDTIARNNVWQAQTPQGFFFKTLYDAHNQAITSNKSDFTDDAAICEWVGTPVKIVKGDQTNTKITSAEDIDLADKQRNIEKFAELADIRVGTGFDAHAFEQGKSLILGGIEIEHDKGLAGHSDSDVVLHTLTDAILGAIAEGDIGEHFPPSNDDYKDASSKIFLENACKRVNNKGGKITHLDITILCELPKIGPYRDAIRNSIAKICEMEMERISVKATTTEKLGFTGRSEGIACIANATVRLPLASG